MGWIRCLFFVVLASAACAAGPGGVGRVAADWLVATKACRAGETVDTAVRLEVAAGWHIYWLNPGDSGMKTAFEWVLPAGWTAGEVGFPAPERFVEEGLVSFGHSGTVVFPVTVTAPVDFKEPVELGLKVSWLVCGEGSCVPGKAELKIRLVPGEPEPTPETARIAEARGRVPRVWDQAARLVVSEAGGRVRIRIEDLGEAAFSWDRVEGFSATPEALAPGVVLRLARQDGAWAAEVPVHEYAAGPLRELCLVFADPERRVPPVQLTWRAKPAP